MACSPRPTACDANVWMQVAIPIPSTITVKTNKVLGLIAAVASVPRRETITKSIAPIAMREIIVAIIGAARIKRRRISALMGAAAS